MSDDLKSKLFEVQQRKIQRQKRLVEALDQNPDILQTLAEGLSDSIESDKSSKLSVPSEPNSNQLEQYSDEIIQAMLDEG